MVIVHYLIVFLHHLQMFRFFPAYFIFCVNKRRLLADFVIWKKNLCYDSSCNFKAFFLIFSKYKEYRFVFYFRLGYDSRAISWLAPADPTIHYNHGTIGEGFFINHGHSTQINAKSIGSNFQIWHNVTIGVKTQFDDNTKPIIGNNVKICSGAVVCGDIVVGNNVTIGANSVVMKSVPDNCVVAGNPARIIYRNGVRCDEQL